MKCLISASINGAWVLGRRADEQLPMDNVVSKVNEFADFMLVKEKTFVAAVMLAELSCGKDEFVNSIKTKLAEVYGEEFPGAELSVEVKELSDNEFEDAKTDGDKPDNKEDADDDAGAERHDAIERRREELIARMQAGLKADREAEEQARTGMPSGDVEKILAEIEGLAGSSEFKELCREVAAVAPVLKENSTASVFLSRSYLFVINDGCGLNTDLELFGKLINATGIKSMSSSRPILECALGPVKESEEPFNDATRMLHMTDPTAPGRILCIDISEWLNNTESKSFKNFLKEVAKQTDVIPVFRVPYVDKFVRDKLYKSLNDVLFIKSVVIPPYTQDELGEYAKGKFFQYGYTLTKSAWNAFFAKLDDERADGRFYGLETVDKVVRELLYLKQVFDATHKNQSDSERKRINGKAAEPITEGIDCTEYGMEALKKLVGSEEIEKRINEIVAQIELSINSGKKRPCIHMQFVGNPGTGKTTVARIVGKILKERGILSVGNFFEHSGRDFCGRYIGETAPKTSGMCRDAYGSVMFIDEAYSLYRGDGNDRDFGREALDTLIAEMENHRSDFVVIMAGYTDEMKTLMDGNAGLRSRVPYTIEFPNFTREQLLDIFKSMAKDQRIENGLFDDAKKYFDGIPDEALNAKEFSNARFVRNLFERTWAKASMRCQLNGISKIELTKDDFSRAILDSEFKFEGENKNKIGFRVNS